MMPVSQNVSDLDLDSDLDDVRRISDSLMNDAVQAAEDLEARKAARTSAAIDRWLSIQEQKERAQNRRDLEILTKAIKKQLPEEISKAADKKLSTIHIKLDEGVFTRSSAFKAVRDVLKEKPYITGFSGYRSRVDKKRLIRSSAAFLALAGSTGATFTGYVPVEYVGGIRFLMISSTILAALHFKICAENYLFHGYDSHLVVKLSNPRRRLSYLASNTIKGIKTVFSEASAITARKQEPRSAEKTRALADSFNESVCALNMQLTSQGNTIQFEEQRISEFLNSLASAMDQSGGFYNSTLQARAIHKARSLQTDIQNITTTAAISERVVRKLIKAWGSTEKSLRRAKEISDLRHLANLEVTQALG